MEFVAFAEPLLPQASSQMQMQDGVGAILTMVQSNQSPGTFTLQCVTLVDATGDPHPIPMEFCHSFEVRFNSSGLRS